MKELNSFQKSLLVLLIVQYLATRFFFSFWYQPPGSDINIYHSYGSDFNKAVSKKESFYSSDKQAVEYPPLAITWMWLPAVFSETDHSGDVSFSSWNFFFKVIYLLLDLFIFGVLLFFFFKPGQFLQTDIIGISVFIVSGILLFNFLYERMDFWLGGILFFSTVLLFSRFHWGYSLFLLAIGINFKLIPLLIAPLFIVGSIPFKALFMWRKELLMSIIKRCLVLLLFVLAIFFPFYLWGGVDTLTFLEYHSARGLQLESFYSSCLMLLNFLGFPVQVTHSYGAYNLSSPLAGYFAAASTVIVLAITLLLFYVFIKSGTDKKNESSRDSLTFAQRNPQMFISVVIVTLLFGILFSKVFSPQYILWVVPLFALLPFKNRYYKTAGILFLVSCALTTPIYPYMYFTEFVRGGTILPNGVDIWEAPSLLASVTLFARNLFLFATAIVITFAISKDDKGYNDIKIVTQ